MSEAHHVYCQKRDLYGSDSDGSFFVPACPPNALYWAFEETRFVNNGSCLRFFGSWRLGCCLNRTSSQKPVYISRSSVQSGIPSLVWFLVSVSVPLFKSISMSGFPSRLSCPVQSVVLLSEAKANPLYCIRSSWLGWAARLYTAWLRYRSYVMVGLKSSIPTIQECLLSSARSFARSKQDEVALLRRQGSFRTLLTSSCSTRLYL
ncbi:hypothetical protein CMV_017406 [Castanea mollissima]|uniref:Uncharacterized protein n=1 Tax=Castanea mollissima TaxID=60419 RepID=A0A8J4QSR0_9ROSI|nr:hypothetical protein CMV_017406 [Castanea mollissima]